MFFSCTPNQLIFCVYEGTYDYQQNAFFFTTSAFCDYIRDPDPYHHSPQNYNHSNLQTTNVHYKQLI